MTERDECITCYERDEDRCYDAMCLRTGCRLRNDRSAARTGQDVAGFEELLKHWQRAADKLEASFQTKDGWATSPSRQVAKHLENVRKKTAAAIAALPPPDGESVTVDTIAQIIAEKIDVLELTSNSVVSVTGIKEAAEAIFATITRKSEPRS